MASWIVAGILLVQDTRIASGAIDVPVAVVCLRAVELAVVVLLGFSSLTIPRRPEVFIGGRPVDGQYTGSAFSRFNFNWPTSLLAYATKKNNLDLGDLPRPDHYTRSKEASAHWKTFDFKGPLWISMVLAHKWAFGVQWAMTLMTSVLQFTPQWVVLQLLRILETRKSTDKIGLEAWIWVIWLGLAIISKSVSND